VDVAFDLRDDFEGKDAGEALAEWRTKNTIPANPEAAASAALSPD
jgi:hypothetical protein